MSDLSNYLCWQKKSRGLKKVFFLSRQYAFSIIARLLLFIRHKTVEQDKADIVLVLRHIGSFDYNPIKQWIHCDYKIKVVVEPEPRDIISERFLSIPSSKPDMKFFIYAAYAKYFMQKYQPKLILTENNGSVISSFLKREGDVIGAKTAHLAHSIPTDNYRKFSFIDYHYYFVYGQSSIDNLKQRDMLYGHCKCVITGSWLLEDRLKSDSKTCLPTIYKNSFLLLGSGPDLEKLPETNHIYRQVIEYCNENGIHLYFKAHPRSNLQIWKNLISQFSQGQYHLIDKIGLDMDQFELAFCGFTNAVLDVSKMGIIPVMLTFGKHEDMFRYREYLGDTVSADFSLSSKIEEIQTNIIDYQLKTKNFGEYHLGGVSSPSKYIAEVINELMQDKEPKYVNLP